MQESGGLSQLPVNESAGLKTPVNLAYFVATQEIAPRLSRKLRPLERFSSRFHFLRIVLRAV
jgi:hypothetical protein